ncbi:MAG: hypothetical protein RR012_01395 [Oscillospiraceae bacterium]
MINESTYKKDNICFSTLLIKPFKHWRMMVIFGVVFAIILGLFKFYPLYKDVKNIDHNQQLANYDQSRNKINAELKLLNETYKNTKEYRENSILLNLNSYNCYSGYLTFYIKSPDSDKNTTLIKAYSRLINNDELIKQITEILGEQINSIYVSELLEVSISPSSSTFSVVFSYHDKEKVEMVNELISKFYINQQVPLSNNIVNHSINVLSSSVQIGLGLTNENNSALVGEDLKNLSIKIEGKKSELESLQNPVGTMSDALTSGVKYAMLGLIIGNFGVYFLFIFKYLFLNKVESDKQLKTAFNRKIYSEFPYISTKNSNFDKFICRCINSNLSLTEEEFINIFWENIQVSGEDNRNILIVGKNNNDILNKLINSDKSNPNIKLELTCSPVNISERLSLLSKSDAVILVVEYGNTSMNEITEEIDLCEFYNKKFLGFIFI